jgi:hypothetical protein
MDRRVGGAGREGQEAIRLVRAVAGHEGDAFLIGELGLDVVGNELLDVDLRVVEKPLRGGRVGVNLARREGQRAEGRRRRLGTGRSLTDPAGTHAARVEQLGEAGRGDVLHRRDLPHLRKITRRSVMVRSHSTGAV